MYSVVGFPGGGKTFTVMHCIQDAVQRGLSVGVFAPAAKLLSLYRHRFGGVCDYDTVHAAFHIEVGSEESGLFKANSSLSKYHLIVIDECSMLRKSIVEHILTTWQALKKWFVLVFVGDFAQTEPVGGRMRVGNALDSERYRRATVVFRLKPVLEGRCKDLGLQTLLEYARRGTVSQRRIDDLVRGRHLGTPCVASVAEFFTRFPQGAVLCFTNKGCDVIHHVAVQHFYQGVKPLAEVRLCRDEHEVEHKMQVYKGMRAMLTYNYSKEVGAVNGAEVRIEHATPRALHVRLVSALAYKLWPRSDEASAPAFALSSAFGITIHKAQGLTLDAVGVWLDRKRLPPGLAYTAVSRTETRARMFFFGELTPRHFEGCVIPPWLE